jgi:hypothetical protein
MKSQVTTGRNAVTILERIKGQIPEPMKHLTIQMQAIQSHIRKAVDMYQKVVPNARELRQEQIRDWAEAAAKRGNKPVAHHFKAMANAEQAKDTFRKLNKNHQAPRQERNQETASTKNKREWSG